MEKKSFVEIKNARVDDQREVMQQIIKDGGCPFCLENFTKYHKLPLLQEGTYWILTRNQWPYEHTKHHFLAVYKTHEEHMENITPEAFAELIHQFNWAVREYAIPGGGISMRFGDMRHSGGTVLHLHAQLVEPDVEAVDYEPVRIKFGMKKEPL